jgi:hypothetical protein
VVLESTSGKSKLPKKPMILNCVSHVKAVGACPAVRPALRGLLLLVFMQAGGAGRAQQVVPALSSDLRDEINPAIVAPPSGAAFELRDDGADEAFFEDAFREMVRAQRPWNARFSLRGFVMSDSNATFSEEGAESTLAYTVTPQVQLIYGSVDAGLSWFVDYALTAAFFDQIPEQNMINHFATTELQARSARLAGSLGLSFRSVQGGDLDIGGQAQRTQWTANGSLTYEASRKSVFGVQGSLDLSDYQNLLGFRRHMAGGYYDYRPTSQLSLGVGFNHLWDEVDTGPRQTGQQFLGRANWNATDRLTLNTEAGWEQRQAGIYDQGTPVFNVGSSYRVSERVSLTANGYRNAMMSPVDAGRFFYRTGGMASINWRPGDLWTVSMAGGLESAKYEGSVEDAAADRLDSIWFIRPSIRWQIGRVLSAEVFYQRTVNESSGEDASGFERDLFGLGLNLSF